MSPTRSGCAPDRASRWRAQIGTRFLLVVGHDDLQETAGQRHLGAIPDKSEPMTRTIFPAMALAFVMLASVAAAGSHSLPFASADADADAPDATVFVVTSSASFAASPLRGIATGTTQDRLGTPLSLAELDSHQLHVLSDHMHQDEGRCGGYFAFASRAEAEEFLARDQSLQAMLAPAAISYTIDNAATVLPWLPQVDAGNIRATIAYLSSHVNRYYSSPTGASSAQWIRDTWAALGNGRSDVHAELFTGCTNCSTQPSVILTVDGAELPGEVVVVGAHLDSILSGGGSSPTQVAPGADDDASGIATITEVIRVALASGWKPKRTVKFMGYAAEEVGLRGSNAIAARFASDGINVVGVLQLDMTNYRSGVAFDLKFITDYGNPPLLAFSQSLFDAYLAPLGLVRSTYACGYGCSDHASWTAAGFPALMAAEAGGPGQPFFNQLHTVNDTLAVMGDSGVNSAKFARFGLAFIGEVAKTATVDPDLIFRHGFD